MTARSVQTIPDVALGGLLLVAGSFAIRDAAGEPGVFEAVIGGLLVAVGIALLARDALVARVSPAPWRPRNFVIVTAVIVVVHVLVLGLGDFALRFGPAEFSAFTALELAVAIALARMSRLRAAGMVLLGLLLSMVGIDTLTGILRLTMGLEALVDGIDVLVVLLGVFVVADAVTCLVSPSRFLAGYRRLVAGWRAPRMPTAAAAGLRIAAAIALIAAGVAAFELNASAWNIGEVLVFGAFGLACKILGWNRLVLVLALAIGTVLEENVRRSLLLSDGDPMIFLRPPVSAVLTIAAGLVLVVGAVLSLRRARKVLPGAP